MSEKYRYEKVKIGDINKGSVKLELSDGRIIVESFADAKSKKLLDVIDNNSVIAKVNTRLKVPDQQGHRHDFVKIIRKGDSDWEEAYSHLLN